MVSAARHNSSLWPSRWVRNSLLSAFFLVSGAAWAQATPPAGPAGAAPARTVPEALRYVNEVFAANPSTWRPCQASPKLELPPDGGLVVTIARKSYCEDSKIRASIRDLDHAAIAFEVTDELLIRIPCQQEAPCGRHWQMKKKRAPEGWVPRTGKWDPSGPDVQPHQVTAIELPMTSDPEMAERVVNALKFLISTAAGTTEYMPPDPFGGVASTGP